MRPTFQHVVLLSREFLQKYLSSIPQWAQQVHLIWKVVGHVMNKIFKKCQNERLIFNDVIVLKIILSLLREINFEDGLKVSEGTNFLIKIFRPFVCDVSKRFDISTDPQPIKTKIGSFIVQLLSFHHQVTHMHTHTHLHVHPCTHTLTHPVSHAHKSQITVSPSLHILTISLSHSHSLTHLDTFPGIILEQTPGPTLCLNSSDNSSNAWHFRSNFQLYLNLRLKNC